jgi:hypothetical protein
MAKLVEIGNAIINLDQVKRIDRRWAKEPNSRWTTNGHKEHESHNGSSALPLTIKGLSSPPQRLPETNKPSWCAAYDGIPAIIANKHHVYLPTAWLAKEYPATVRSF